MVSWVVLGELGVCESGARWGEAGICKNAVATCVLAELEREHELLGAGDCTFTLLAAGWALLDVVLEATV